MQNNYDPRMLELVKQSEDFINSLTFQKLSNGETLAYRSIKCSDTTSKKSIILLPGNLCSSYIFDTLSVLLQPYFNVIALDIRGFGNSSNNTQISTIQDFADDVKLFCDQIKIKNFVILGLSTGGGVAQAFASKYPDYIDRIILCGAVTCFGCAFYKADQNGQNTTQRIQNVEDTENSPIFAALIKEIQKGNYEFIMKMFNAYCYNNNEPEPKERCIAQSKSFVQQKNYSQVLLALNKFNLTHQKDEYGGGNGEVDKIICPVLVLHGDKDLLIPLDTVKENVKLIGDNAKLVVIEEGSHVFFLQNYEKLNFTFESILNFCNFLKK